MDPEVEVIEIFSSSSSFHRNNSPRRVRPKKRDKNKLLSTLDSNHHQAIHHEVIDVDDDDEDFIHHDKDSNDVIIIDEKIDIKSKGKAPISNKNEVSKSKDTLDGQHFGTVEMLAAENNDPTNIDNFLYNYDDVGDDGCMGFDGHEDVDEYSYLQSHFDNFDIPAGVEAPIPWLPNSVQKGQSSRGFCPSKTSQMEWNSLNSGLAVPAHVSKKSNLGSSSSLQTKVDSTNHSWSKKMHTGLQQGGVTSNLPSFSSTETSLATSSSSIYGHGNQWNSSFSNGIGESKSFYPSSPFSPVYNQGGFGTLNVQSGSSNILTHGGNDLQGVNPPFGWPSYQPNVAPQPSWIDVNLKSSTSYYPVPSNFNNPSIPLPTPPLNDVSGTPRNVDTDVILAKFELFEQFDTVEDYSDHHYNSKGFANKLAPKNWAKRIQEEWKILQNDLPGSIYVRAYEARMDLLRAVIVGAEGTPYHDGLFFFDILFPSGYPKVPPQVYYHAHGLRLNPNLYACGKVCLSLLGTWQGNDNEKWIPGVSTCLQVLVSIQALILNQQPYFNEPGYEYMRRTPHGEIQSQQYNETTFLLSLKTMIYTIRNAPKHFKDFVVGHFHKHAHDILVACRSYIDGAQVGSLVKGGVQDVDEGDKSCSKSFRDSLPGYVDILVHEFLLLGVRDCEKYQKVDNNTSTNPVSNVPKATVRVN